MDRLQATPSDALAPRVKDRRFTSGRHGWFWQQQPRTQAGQDGSPGRCRPSAPPPRYAERTAVRAFIATADGTGAPAIRAAWLNSSPKLADFTACLGPCQTFYLCRRHTHMDARKHVLHGDAAGCPSHGGQPGPVR